MNEQDFVKRFNQGYQIARSNPELGSKILKGIGDNDPESHKSLISGIQQFQAEEKERLIQAKLQQWRDEDATKDRDKDQDIDI